MQSAERTAEADVASRTRPPLAAPRQVRAPSDATCSGTDAAIKRATKRSSKVHMSSAAASDSESETEAAISFPLSVWTALPSK